MAGGWHARLPTASHQAWTAAFTGDYDAPEQHLLASLMRPGTLVVDVGACFGSWTVPLAAAARGKGATVVAFEPVAENAAILRSNLEENGLADVATVFEVALGATPGSSLVQIESSQGGNAAIRSDSSLAPPGPAEATIRVERLDDLGLQPATHALTKIDVEGYELAALEGGEQFVAQSRPINLGEFNPDWLEARQVPASRPADWVRTHRYRAYRITATRTFPLSDRRRLAPVPVDPPVPGSDPLLLVPHERSADLRGVVSEPGDQRTPVTGPA